MLHVSNFVEICNINYCLYNNRAFCLNRIPLCWPQHVNTWHWGHWVLLPFFYLWPCKGSIEDSRIQELLYMQLVRNQVIFFFYFQQIFAALFFLLLKNGPLTSIHIPIDWLSHIVLSYFSCANMNQNYHVYLGFTLCNNMEAGQGYECLAPK